MIITNQIAKDTYKKFSKALGADYIASEFALITILRIIDTFKINQILEIGLGIGSISDTVLNYARETNKNINYTGTEANEFCLNQLPLNLKDNYGNIKLLNNVSQIDKEAKFDLIIVDGSDNSLEKLKYNVKPNSIIFIEGLRTQQVKALKKLFPNSKHVEIISNYKSPSYGVSSPSKWSGGGQLIFINPTVRQYVFWIKNKIRTSFIYKVGRKLKK